MTTKNGGKKRLIKLPKDHSFFLFGPRGSGKSTLIDHEFKKNKLVINLLDPEMEHRFANNPTELSKIVTRLPKSTKHVIIDEVQKVPKLLDLVHYLIESTDKIFILTGSSARKLKYGGANLLAGRAFVYHLHPFTSLELLSDFDLTDALRWGLLPKLYSLDAEEKKTDFLNSYALTYLKEEIWAEQFIKKLDPFRYFLEVSAQSNGKVVNFSNIAKDVGVEDKTVKQYYSILEDTLIGFFLHPFKHSFRKRLTAKPKFYFFDTGVTRALTRSLAIPLQEGTYAYGDVLEHFIILECHKLASYHHRDYRFNYFKTKDDAEIDLVVERPGKKILFIEIKSSKRVDTRDINIFSRLAADFGDCEAVCFSDDPFEKQVNNIRVLPWQDGLREFFT